VSTSDADRADARRTATGGGFDPTAPLPGPPDPWTSTSIPERRDGPPYHMTDMIEAEPWLARRLLERLAAPTGSAARLAGVAAEVSASGAPIVLTGCGTSEHGALGGAELLGEALRSAHPSHASGPIAVQALELALRPPTSGLVIGVSHEGATGATNDALRAARRNGVRTALITVSDRSPGAAIVERELVVTTGELDQSWCHTVGYLSPLVALASVAGHLSGRALDDQAIAALLDAGLASAAGAQALAGRLSDVDAMVVVGSGADRPAGRELVLKLEEGTWIPSAYRDLETMLHGHWPATGTRTGLVLVLTDRESRGARVGRARQLLDAARRIGLATGAILAEGVAGTIDPATTAAGRIVLPEAPALPPAAAALLGTAIPLQLLTERLARARGTDPDPIRRDDPIYRDAAAAAED
jgi:glucosamine--fructose-6-phosphate aminotransferase (isomerizing)